VEEGTIGKPRQVTENGVHLTLLLAQRFLGSLTIGDVNTHSPDRQTRDAYAAGEVRPGTDPGRAVPCEDGRFQVAVVVGQCLGEYPLAVARIGVPLRVEFTSSPAKDLVSGVAQDALALSVPEAVTALPIHAKDHDRQVVEQVKELVPLLAEGALV